MNIHKNNASFEGYQNRIIGYAEKGKYKKALTEIQRAEKIKDLTNSQLWLLDYWTTLLILTYEKEWNRDKMCGALSELRSRAIEISYESNESYEKHNQSKENIIEEYISVLYHLLILQTVVPADLLKYEEVAREFLDLVEHIDYSEFVEEDLYAFASTVMAIICGLKGQILLKEKYLHQILEKYKADGHLTIYGLIGIYNLAETKTQLGKNDEAAELYFYLLDELLDQEIDITGREMEEARLNVQDIIQGSVMGIMTAAAQANQLERGVDFFETCMYQTHLIQHLRSDDCLWLLYVKYLSAMHILEREVDKDLLDEIAVVMSEVTEEQLYWEVSYEMLQYYYVGCYYLAKARGDENAIANIDNAMKFALTGNTSEIDRITYLSYVRIAMIAYKMEGAKDKAVTCSEDILKKLVWFYSMAELDQDNAKLEQYLSICNYGFMTAYAAVETDAALQKRFEYRMNYKNILGSVIRLRNKHENNFERIKNRDEFPFYTYEQFSKLLPAHTVVLDFYFFNREIVDRDILQTNYYDEAQLEVILVKKGETEISIKSSGWKDISYLSERILKLKEIVQSKRNKYNKVAGDLYDILFGAFTEEGEVFENVERVYLSPDYILNDIPFELVFEAVKSEKTMELIYLSSLRNLFERADGVIGSKMTVTEGNACIIGSPAYEVEENLNSELTSEERSMITHQLPNLMWSRFEALKISEMMKGDCFVGKEATKYVIKPGYQYLHIATHGLVPERYENAWYESNLAFSGATDFLISGHEKECYGNGILSAEEISKMNMEDTQLAVLSACDSGRSLLSRFWQQSGLHIAFGAAGVKYIISSLWKADDLATALMMNYFYQALYKCVSIPSALQQAKMSLKSMKVRDIRLVLNREREICGEMAEEILQLLEGYPDENCLYSAPYFWAGFICYQYKF